MTSYHVLSKETWNKLEKKYLPWKLSLKLHLGKVLKAYDKSKEKGSIDDQMRSCDKTKKAIRDTIKVLQNSSEKTKSVEEHLEKSYKSLNERIKYLKDCDNVQEDLEESLDVIVKTLKTAKPDDETAMLNCHGRQFADVIVNLKLAAKVCKDNKKVQAGLLKELKNCLVVDVKCNDRVAKDDYDQLPGLLIPCVRSVVKYCKSLDMY